MKERVLLTVVALLFWSLPTRAESIKLELHGVGCAGCAGALTEAMSKVPSVKVVDKPTKKVLSTTSITVVDIDLSKADLGELAKTIADTETPHRSKEAPSSYLIIEASSLTKANAKTIDDALKAVRGVDARESKADVKKKEISVKLDSRGGAKLADIQKALSEYLKKG